MAHTTWGQEFIKELEDESKATRLCLERFDEKLYDYKPHAKSMIMGYLALLLAEIPRWIETIAKGEDIDFATWKSPEARTAPELLKHFDKTMAAAKAALGKISDEDMLKPFYLKRGEQVLAESSRRDAAGSSINHLVHHRGQYTVYMRLNGIPVPSIYGPSADDPNF